MKATWNWQSEALAQVLEERLQQNQKWGEQNHDIFVWLAVLVEEVGELSQAGLQARFGGPHGTEKEIHTEALHVAAVALALVESLLRNWAKRKNCEYFLPEASFCARLGKGCPGPSVCGVSNPIRTVDP